MRSIRVRSKKRSAVRKRAAPRPAPVAELRRQLRDAQRRVREIERRHELAMAAVNESCFDWDIARGTFMPARNMSRVLGLAHERLTLQAWQQAVHPDDYARFREATLAHLKGDTERFACDYRFRAADGAWHWARTHGMAIRDRRGRAVRLIGSTGDITELKRAEEEVAHAHAATRTALEQQTATAEILKVIAASPTDTQPVFDAIVNSVSRLFGRKAALRTVEADGLRRRARSYDPEPGEYHGRDVEALDHRSIVGQAVLEGRALQWRDTLVDGAAVYGLEHAKRLSFRSIASAPLLREGRAIGVISVSSPVPGELTAKQMELLATFADQAVIAIENVRLFNETREALERQTATAEVLRVISGSPTDTQPVFDAIVHSCQRLFSGQSVWLALVEDGNIHPKAGVDASGARLAMTLPSWQVDRGSASGVVALEARAVNLADLSRVTDELPRMKDLALSLGFRSGLWVPLRREGGAIGVLGILRHTTGAFTEQEVALAQTFADQAVIAIENVRLFNETKEALEQQRASAEVLNVISNSVSDAQPVFEKIVESCERIFATSRVGLNLIGPDGLVHAGAYGRFPGAEKLRTENFPHPVPGSATGAAISAGRPIQYPDALGGPDVPTYARRGAETVGFRAFIMAPLLSEERGLGAIFVGRETAGSFSEKESALLKTFADQAVIAIENARLFNETKEALERQTATAEILKVISSSPSEIQPVFDAIAESAKTLLRGLSAVVTRVVDDRQYLVAYTRSGLPGDDAITKLFPAAIGAWNSGRAILTRAPAIRLDTETDPDIPPEGLENARARGYRSLIAVPMLRDDKAIGSISVTRRDPGPFGDNEIGLLKTFADQAVIAIENVRLFNETKEALERQTATAAVLRVISASPSDVGPVFAEILDHATQLCDAQLGFVFTTDGSAFEPVAQRGLDAEQYAAWCAAFQVNRVARPMSGLGRVLVTCAPVHIADVTDDEAYRTRDPMRVLTVERLGARTFLAVPLLKDGAVIGAVVIYRREVRPFSDKQIVLLKTFADQAVIAIENVRLFKELQSRTEALTRSVGQLTALSEVGQAISSTLDLEQVLKAIVSRAVQLSGLDAGVIYEYDAATDRFELRASERFDDSGVDEFRGATIRRGEGAVGRCVETREPVQVTDTHAPDYPIHLRELLDRSGFRALLAVPLLREDHIIGALMVIRRSPGEFAAETVEMLRTFAGQSALAIQNARLFREIAEKSRQLEEASKHKSQFLASMSHELRTPLNAILGFNEMILGEIYGAVPADMQGPLADIQSSGKHLLRLINNVLDLAKIEAGRMELALADYSVHDTVETVRSTLRPLAAEKGLEFTVTMAEDIPLAHGDSGRVTQCLVNLAGNSLKFTKSGKVAIAVEHRGDMLRFSVTDTGIGIPPDKIGGLFTEFKQTDATIASEYGGSGLGLSIVKKFVEMHGGRIWVESELGRGSTFAFEIPLRTKEKAASP